MTQSIDSGTFSADPLNGDASLGEAPPPEAPSMSDAEHQEDPLDYEELVGQAKAWVSENQGLAMLGAFGLGVFLGVMMRR